MSLYRHRTERIFMYLRVSLAIKYSSQSVWWSRDLHPDRLIQPINRVIKRVTRIIYRHILFMSKVDCNGTMYYLLLDSFSWFFTHLSFKKSPHTCNNIREFIKCDAFSDRVQILALPLQRAIEHLNHYSLKNSNIKFHDNTC